MRKDVLTFESIDSIGMEGSICLTEVSRILLLLKGENPK